MPNFGQKPESFNWGYDLDELTDMIAMTLKESLEKENKQSCILVTHDWGAVLGSMLFRKFPHLVEKVVQHEVEIQKWEARPNFGLFVFGLIAGVIYQWMNALGLIIASIPVVGIPIATKLQHFVTCNTNAPLCQDEQGRQRTNPMMNYPYLWFTVYSFAECFGLRKGFDARHGIRAEDVKKVPTMFVYKTPWFHSKKFEQEMRDREDCDVVRLIG